jgi:site-specific recombinase XerD
VPRLGRESRRGELSTDIDAFEPYINSFELCLQIGEKSERTQTIYLDAARWFAGWLVTNDQAGSWFDVGRDQVRAFFLYLKDINYAQSYRNQAGRSLQAFFKWFSEEEDVPNPFTSVKPPPAPKAGEVLKPVLPLEQLAILIKDAEHGKDFRGFEARRDAALLRLFACTGIRIGELAGLDLADVDIKNRTAKVTGKGGKQRIVKFDQRCTQALDRYVRVRAAHKAAKQPALWLGISRDARMTTSGIRQIVDRRATALGMTVNPHMFRHTFTHNWLDAGGAEGDLMALNGWSSAQMLRHYGAAARGARAARAYDRIDVMRGV